MAEKNQEWRALVDLDWVDGEGNSHHAGAGDKIPELPDNVVRHEKPAQHIEEWVSGKTENVRDVSTEGTLYGVAENEDGVLEEVNLNG